MTKLSANLGFLWADLPLPDAIRAAKAHGFDAVECHWPYDVPTADVIAALEETGLSMLGLNTSRGDVAGGENGLSALPRREKDARKAIDQAVEYAKAIGCGKIHVMAGFTSDLSAHATFVDNLRYACRAAAPHGISILIEPLNRYDAPGYFLKTTAQARAIIEEVDETNLALMFDCYHVQLTEGDLSHRLEQNLDIIGHIQFAGVPARGRPDVGEINFSHVFDHIASLGYTAPLGAEYKPGGPTEPTLDWMTSLS
ncbi:hydroxypyruvate isomerase family protein [Oceaniglobus indicus]|uniref:hydroxypyruvate isomerase family protein n=1 Tax=Oceaniglobus indicus TaxID=2047749 RepID=UPI000C17A54D|nr:TIM barrel protein [Oceaniglobus indicus]